MDRIGALGLSQSWLSSSQVGSVNEFVDVVGEGANVCGPCM